MESQIANRTDNWSAIEQEIVNACLEAVSEVLKVGAKLACQPGNPTPPPTDSRLLVGKIDIRGDWLGVIELEMPYILGALLTARFIGCEISDLDEVSIRDGVGEIINQVAGRVRTELSREGRDLRIGIPSVESTAGESGWPGPGPLSISLVCQGYPLILSLHGHK